MTQPAQAMPPRSPVQEMPYRSGQFPSVSQTIRMFQVINVVPQRTWGEWAGDRIQNGIGAAIESLVAGIFLGLGQLIIEGLGKKIKASYTEETEALKLAAFTQDCQSIL